MQGSVSLHWLFNWNDIHANVELLPLAPGQNSANGSDIVVVSAPRDRDVRVERHHAVGPRIKINDPKSGRENARVRACDTSAPTKRDLLPGCGLVAR